TRAKPGPGPAVPDLLPHHVGRVLVIAHAEVGGRPEPARGRPLPELDLDDELRLHPDGMTSIFRRNAGAERRAGPSERVKSTGQRPQALIGESRADMAGVDQAVPLMHADDQGSDEIGPVALPRLPAADHDLLPVHVLDLPPAG